MKDRPPVPSCACTAATTRLNGCPARAITAIIVVRHVANTASQEPKNAASTQALPIQERLRSSSMPMGGAG